MKTYQNKDWERERERERERRKGFLYRWEEYSHIWEACFSIRCQRAARLEVRSPDLSIYFRASGRWEVSQRGVGGFHIDEEWVEHERLGCCIPPQGLAPACCPTGRTIKILNIALMIIHKDDWSWKENTFLGSILTLNTWPQPGLLACLLISVGHSRAHSATGPTFSLGARCPHQVSAPHPYGRLATSLDGLSPTAEELHWPQGGLWRVAFVVRYSDRGVEGRGRINSSPPKLALNLAFSFCFFIFQLLSYSQIS